MGEPSPPKSPSVRSRRPSFEQRSIHNQLRKHSSPTLSPSARSKKGTLSDKPKIVPPLTPKTSSGQRSPSVKAADSPLQKRNSPGVRTTSPVQRGNPTTGVPSPVQQKNLDKIRTPSPQERNSISIKIPSPVQRKNPTNRAPSPVQKKSSDKIRTPSPKDRNSINIKIRSPVQEQNSVTGRKSGTEKEPSFLQQGSSRSATVSKSEKSPSPLQRRNSASPTRLSISDKTPYLFVQRNSASLKESIPDTSTSYMQKTNSVSPRKSLSDRTASIIKTPSFYEQTNSASVKEALPDTKTRHLQNLNSISPRKSSPNRTPSLLQHKSSQKMHQETSQNGSIFQDVVNLEPQGKTISEHMDELNETVKKLSESIDNNQTPAAGSNIEKIANMSQILTSEAKVLRNSIKSLSEDIARTKHDLGMKSNTEDYDLSKVPEHPYHLFLLELIVNRIQMKCECFDIDAKNLVIAASFLGKPPVVLNDSTCGKIQDFTKLNMGKSILSAMTYERICEVKRFLVFVEISKQPPCSHCVTKIGETLMDFTQEFAELRQGLCNRWQKEKPNDDILCTASTPMIRHQYYLSCGESHLENPEAIGLIEMSVRMSFLGKEITTAFGPKREGTSVLLKQNSGITMYSCQKVEMDDTGKVLLDEELINKREEPSQRGYIPASRSESPMSHCSISRYISTKRYVEPTISLGPQQGNK